MVGECARTIYTYRFQGLVVFRTGRTLSYFNGFFKRTNLYSGYAWLALRDMKDGLSNYLDERLASVMDLVGKRFRNIRIGAI